MEIDVRELCRAIDEKRLKRLITWDEYEIELAYVSMMDVCFKELIPHTILPDKPRSMDGYERLNEKDKMALGADPDVKMYFKKLTELENHNKTMVERLKELQMIIPQGDTKAHDRITRRLEQFDLLKTPHINTYMERSFAD